MVESYQYNGEQRKLDTKEYTLWAYSKFKTDKMTLGYKKSAGSSCCKGSDHQEALEQPGSRSVSLSAAAYMGVFSLWAFSAHL